MEQLIAGGDVRADTPAMQALVRAVQRCAAQAAERELTNLKDEVSALKWELRNKRSSWSKSPRSKTRGAEEPVHGADSGETKASTTDGVELEVPHFDLQEKDHHLPHLREAAQVRTSQGRKSRIGHGGHASREDVESVALHGSLLDEQLAYTFEENLWDANMFNFTNSLGMFASIVNLSGLLFCLVFQVTFIASVTQFMTTDPVTDETLHDLLLFRGSVGHDVAKADTNLGISMTQQICEQSNLLYMAGDQSGLFAELDEFVKPFHGSDLTSGELLSVLAQTAWMIMMFNEMILAIRMARGMLAIPTGSKTELLCEAPDGVHDLNTLRAKSFSRLRKVSVMLALLVPRVLVCFFLTLAGVKWLGVTASLGDLVLNAMALGFVIDMNGLIYTIIVPVRTTNLIAHLQPINVSETWSQRKAKISFLMPFCQLFTLIVLVLTIHVIYVNQTSPFMQRLKQARLILCGGDQQFIFAENAVSGMIHETATKAYVTSNHYQPDTKVLAVLQRANVPYDQEYKNWLVWPDMVSPTVEKMAIQEAMEAGNAKSDDLLKQTDFLWVKTIGDASKAEASGLLPCADLGLDVNESVMVEHIKRVTGERTVRDCEDVRLWCFDGTVAGNVVRSLCPITCKCYDPNPRFLNSADNGCSTVCMDLSALVLFYRDCTDIAPRVFHERRLRIWDDWGETMWWNYSATLVWSARQPGNFKKHLEFIVPRILGSDFDLGPWSLEDYIDYVMYNQSFYSDVYSFRLGPGTSMLNSGTVSDQPQGCEFLTSVAFQMITGISTCAATDEYQSIRYICPQSCKCDLGDPQCPNSCGVEEEESE